MATKTALSSAPADLPADVKARLTKVRDFSAAAEEAGRDFTPAERAEAKQVIDEIATIKRQRDGGRGAAAKQLDAILGGVDDPDLKSDDDGRPAAFLADFASTARRKVRGLAADHRAKHDGEPAAGLKALVPSGTIAIEERDAANVALPDAPHSLLQLVRGVPATTAEISYLRQTVRTNNAAPVAAGGTKPTSVFSIEKVTDTIRKIAHVSEPLPTEYFEDDASIADFIEMEMGNGVVQALIDQILNGDGTGEEFTGILNTSGTTGQVFDTSPIVTLRRAIAALEDLSIRPTAIVLNGDDWADIELAAGEDGHYIVDGLPTDPGPRRLFGVPVVAVPQLAEGTGIVANWDACRIRYRNRGTIDWSEHAGANWASNLVTWRAEIRATLAVKQPLAFAVADLEAGG